MKKLERYYNLSTYNRIKILNKIKKMIIKEGGKILDHQGDFIYSLYCRTNSNDQEVIDKIDKLPCVKMHNDSKYTISPLYTEFILNNHYYYLSCDENPFFPTHYQKIKIDDNGNYYGKRYIYNNETINDREWKKNKKIVFSMCYDNIFKICNDKQINSMAIDFYNAFKKYVVDGPEAERTSERTRVNNYYNNGFHYETIYNNEKMNIYKKF